MHEPPFLSKEHRRALSSPDGTNLALEVEVEGTKIPLRVRPGAAHARNALFLFHGAVDRATREVPAFAPFLPDLSDQVHQIAISDPSILARDGFGMSWYAGHEGFAGQDILRRLIAEIAEALNARRLLFFGSSGGGFGALYFSWHFPDSFCICACPQTSMHSYYSGHILRYRESCWPALADNDALAGTVCTDVTALYKQGFPNFVIYLQSPGDYFHLKTQVAPFLNRMKLDQKASRFVLDCTFRGRLGHSGSVPVADCLPWIRTALLAEPGTADDLLQTHHALTATSGKARRAPAPSKGKAAYDAADLKRAALLKTLMLKT